MKHLSKISFFICLFFLSLTNTYSFIILHTDSSNASVYDSYNIYRYVLSSGGILNALSTNYKHHSTVGETFIVRIQGTNNIVQLGFWSGGLFTTDIGEKSTTEIPTTFMLFQNFPNPWNPSTTIEYTLKIDCNVKLAIFNSVGEEIAVLVNDEQDKGYHKVEFDGSKLSSGVYFYKLVAKDFVSTKKMMLIK